MRISDWSSDVCSSDLLHCDVSSEDAVRVAMRRVRDTFGRIDFLVNNAGIQRYGAVTETSVEVWDEVMNVNLKSLFLCSKYVIPIMQEQKEGVIINVASRSEEQTSELQSLMRISYAVFCL